MAVTYANETKKVKPIYFKAKDSWGREVLREAGFHLTFYADETTGGLAQGPYVEPGPINGLNSDLQFYGEGIPTGGFDIIGFEIVDTLSRDGGGLFGFWCGPVLR